MKSRDDQPVIREQSITYDEYARMADDGQRYELADGVLELMSPAPTPKHQALCNQLLITVSNSCQSDYIILASPIDLILSLTEIRQPDLVIIHRDKLNIITPRGIEGVPDLVVEILSPHSVRIDRLNKQQVYAKYRIPEYWIVDPGNEALEQYILAEDRAEYSLTAVYSGEDIVRSERMPCVSFTMGRIMEAVGDIPG